MNLGQENIVKVILRNAELLSERIAIVDSDGSRKTSWQEFGTLITQIAAYASHLGVKGVVPVLQKRSMEYVATVMGLQLAGLAISPLTKDTPKKRLEYIKSDLGAEIVADEAFVESAKALNTNSVSPCHIESDIAWVIYTSGSTGHPKGMIYSHSALSSVCAVTASINKLSEKTVSASASAFSFCASIVDLYAPLCCGGTVHILSDECRKDNRLLEKYLFNNSINYTFISPRMLANISAELPKMKLIATAGEKVSGISPRRYQINVFYGMTETLAPASYFVLDNCYDNTPIGKAVEGKNIYLLDEDGKLSDEGEICISGVIAEGYWNLPELTAQAFTDNPFSDDPRHKKLLHTGDMAKRLPDGNLLFLNRKDWMLKINGQRVEPGEIEHQIKAIKGVNEAVVKGFENSHSQTYLCAWYTGDITENELKFQLADSLSSYMMPAFIIKLDAFPINANGKLDRKALNAPDASSFLTTYEAPINELETAICNGFQKTLGMEQIGRNDDFFSLGGDSISAITLCSELKAYQLQSFHIFAGRTPKGIAAICCGQTADSLKSPQESYVPTALQLSHDLQEQESYLLTAGQTGIYYASINAPLDLSYNLPFDCKLPLETNIIQLRGAIEKVLHTFPAFGVRFQVIDGQPRMVKREPYIEIETRYAQEAETTEIKRHFIRPFDMEKGELARFMIVKTELALYLLADIHHIIFDGSSAKVLLSAISNAYMGEAITPEDISIFQAACMEENAVSTPAYSRAYEFFHKQLTTNDFEGSLPSDLPTNEQNEQNITGVGESVEYHFSEATDAIQIEHFARKNGITESTLFMGAFAWAFSKMTNTQNIGFCTAENGRPTAEYYNSIGMLVRTLPLSLSIDESLSAGAYLCEVSKLFYETIANDSYPFYKLAGEFGLNNDTMFVYQAEMLDNFNFNANPIQVEQLDTRYALSKLAVSVYKSKGRYKASITYRSDLYSINRIQTLCSLMQAALSGFVKGLSLKDIPLVSDADIQLLDSFHGKDTDVMESDSVAIPSTITDMLNHAIKLYPDNTAIVSGEKRLTYKELDEVTDRLAAYIVGQGIGREDVVAILADRDEMMAICPIAVIKAGAMYQPLDSSYPTERLNFMLKDSGAKLLITPKHLRPLVDIDSVIASDSVAIPVQTDGRDCHGSKLPRNDNKITVFYTEDIRQLPERDNVLPTVRPEDAFVILYTSGSTGLPKGCVLEHRNLVSYIDYYTKYVNLNSESKTVAYASFGFDASMQDLFPALCVGASVYLIPQDMRLELEVLNQYFEEKGITHAFMTTQVGRQFTLTNHNKSIKCLIIGGEALINYTPHQDYPILNAYGPTETTIIVSFFPLNRFYQLAPLGKANDNVHFYVLDPYMRRVPAGLPGELFIAGPQVSRGYLNLPEKTAQCFLDNPFSDDHKYKRMYRTGDIVYFLPDGNLQFIGRKDAQVKIRGFRIELSEVEEVIRRYEGIKNVAVTVFDDPNSGKYLAAYIVSDSEIDIEKLNAYIRSEKPAYMVPAVTMQIESIPLTPNHKVNKKALPVPVRKIDNIIQPQNEVQHKIFDLTAEVLGHKEFGINTDLEYAGLSSISSVKLLSLLSKAFDRPLSLKELKENGTVEKLDKLLSEGKEREEFELREEYPLTKTQEGIFYECMNKPNSTFYNVPYLIELGQGVEIEKLKNAITQTLNVHPYLMTRLSLTLDGIRCSRDTNARFSISDIEEFRVDSTCDLATTLCKPFELQGGNLFRIAIIYSESSTYLLIDVHHIIFDGSSLSILIEDINRAYSGESLETERFSGYEAALHEQTIRSTEALDKAKQYYNELFAEQSDSSLPYGDYPDASGYSSYNHTMQNLSQTDIDAFCHSAKLTGNTVFTAAFGFLLAKYQNDDCAIFTTVYDGRNDSRLARSISMYVKTYPVLCDISQNDIAHYLNGVARQLETSRLNDIYSFAEIHQDLGINADVMFVYQDTGFEHHTFCGDKLVTQEVQIDTEKAPLSINVTLKNSKICLSVEYDASKYSREYIKSFVEAYEQALIGITSKNKLNDIELVDDKALAILESFHGEDIDVIASDSVAISSTATVTDMIRQAMQLYPDNIAVVSGHTKISYRELDDITDRLAAYIVGKGIGREDVVAILADRDEMMVICPIAVSKAGAMYLPLDSSYPSERLDYMIQDSGAKLLILPYNLHQIIGADIEEFYTEGIKKLPKCDILLPSPSPNDAFVMLYTSGSTGKPKGCILEHTNFTHYCKFYHKRFNYSDDCAVAQYASFGFDASMMDTFATLSSGASLYIIPFDMRLDLHSLNRYLEANKITHIFMTTQIGRQFALLEENHSLKYLILGGEALAPIAPNANYTIANGYGPSETCCGVSFFDIDKLYKSVPLGKPNTNTKAYIVDKQFHRVPVGMPGELCIAGPQVSRGYINLPEKTAVSYINNPFSNHPKYNRIYKTGDIVCFLPDGNLQFVGRKDSQVKINGFRIELTAVEDVIRRFEGIKDATVTVFDHPNGEKLLVAYVVSDHEVDIEKLNMFIRSEKPAYMVPSVTMQIDKIPLTHNHKVNKRALPTPIVNSHREYIQPQNTTEEDLCTIMGETLNIAKFSAADSFFELGGSSISATKVLVSAMAKGYKITYADLFCHQSPRKIAEYLNLTNTHKNHDDIVQYDYSKIDKLISQSSIESIDDAISHNPSILNGNLGNLLLTGVTGFLGIHILHRFITSYTGNITCIIRKKDTLSTEERLKTLLFYYFSDDCAEAFENGRITVIEASINDNDLSDKLKPVDFDSVIHCAASVLHFASDDILYSNNVEGTVNLLKICEERKKRFIHISTGSIAGFKHEAQTKEAFTEHDLYIAQQIDNDYIRTKYLAERYLLEAALRGVDVKILRVGNLTNRLYDGEFQINFHTNGFMRNMRGVLALGHSSEELEDKLFNLSPIDCTAEAVLRIADSDVPNYIYHVYNDKLTKLSELTKAFQECGFPMRIVPETEYREQIAWAIQKYKGDDYMSDTIAGLIAYKDATTGTELESVETSNEFTIQVLSRLGFIWPKIEMSYIKRMINIMTDMGFFEKYEKTLFDM